MDETTSLKGWSLAVYRKLGKLTPEIVREEARPEDSPAHQYVFNVKPEDAAEEYYLERAHRLIRAVKVTVVRDDGEAPRRVRFFHAVPGDEDAFVYLTVDDLVRNPDKLAAARTEAVRRLHDAEHAVEDLDALAVDTPTASATKEALRSVRAAQKVLAGSPATV